MGGADKSKVLVYSSTWLDGASAIAEHKFSVRSASS